MPELPTTGCILTCAFGDAPSAFVALCLSGKPMIDAGLSTARIMEMARLDIIPWFGMCTSITNPGVAASTAAAEGVLTPMPCLPVTNDPWNPPGQSVLYNDTPLATWESKCLCAWEGEISVDDPLETAVTAS